MKWKKGRILSLILGNDNQVRGVEIIEYQPNLKQIIKLKRPLQLIVSFEVNDRNTDVLTEQIETIDGCNENLTEQPIVTIKCPRRIAAQNADIIRQLLDR